jgi:DNA topoisomerase-3
MVTEVVNNVLSDNTNRHITIQEAVKEEIKKESKKRERKPSAPKAKKEPKASPKKDNENGDNLIGQPCPLCGKGVIIKGKNAYGCSEWKAGCTFRKGFDE